MIIILRLVEGNRTRLIFCSGNFFSELLERIC